MRAVEAGKGLSSIDSWDGYEQYDEEDNTALPEGEETGTLDERDEGFTEASLPEPTESEKEQPEVEEETVGQTEPALRGEEVETAAIAEFSGAASKPSGHIETATGQDEEATMSATWHEQEEHLSTNAEDIAGVKEPSENERVDEDTGMR